MIAADRNTISPTQSKMIRSKPLPVLRWGLIFLSCLLIDGGKASAAEVWLRCEIHPHFINNAGDEVGNWPIKNWYYVLDDATKTFKRYLTEDSITVGFASVFMSTDMIKFRDKESEYKIDRRTGRFDGAYSFWTYDGVCQRANAQSIRSQQF